MSDQKRTGIWEVNYVAPEVEVCKAGASQLYGRTPRDPEKPLAIVYADEILVPEGVAMQMIPDMGAVRIRLTDREAMEASQAMTEAQAELDADRAWAKHEADRLISEGKNP